MTLQKDSHCGWCGQAFADGQAWPRTCGGCGQVSYRNPLPVAVLLEPVGGGLLLIRRGIEPARGQLAFPGGYVNLGETWQQAAVRELFEETGLKVRRAAVRDFRVLTVPERDKLVIFGVAAEQPERLLRAFRPTEEATALEVATRPRRLAFSTHTRAMKEYFSPG